MKQQSRGTELASQKLFDQVTKDRKNRTRTIAFALEGSEELRYLDSMQCHANVGCEKMTHILLRVDARKIEVLEEFLHGTQYHCQMIQHAVNLEAEIHVKEFMMRFRRVLQICDHDVAKIRMMLGDI